MTDDIDSEIVDAERARALAAMAEEAIEDLDVDRALDALEDEDREIRERADFERVSWQTWYSE